MSVIRPLVGHTSPETAFLIADYPYGRKLRCQRRVWIEHSASHGFRFVAQTTNPKNGRWNKPHKSTYSEIAMALYLDEDGHVQHSAITAYSSSQVALSFAKYFGSQCEGAVLLRAFALNKAAFCRKLATGEAYFTINGTKCEPTEADKAENLREAGQWLETAELLNPERLGQTSPTLEPVTTSGWYECADGTIAEFVWRAGVLHRGRSVASWADVPENRYELAKDEP